MVKCYILASVSNVLQHQHQDLDHAFGMMTILKEMLGEQNRIAKSGTMKSLLIAKMAEDTLVREHCLSMIAMFNSLEVLGTEIDGESQVDIILHSLPDSYNQFRLNVTMNKQDFTFSKLMNELIAAEGILKTKVSVNMAQASSSKPKGKKKKNQIKQVGKVFVKRFKKAENRTNGKQGSNCYYCDQPGHWKRNCNKFLATIGQGEASSLLVETCLVVNPINSWCVDLRPTNHVCNSLQRFRVTRQLNEGEMYLTLGDGTMVPVHSIGIVELYFESRVLILTNIYMYPTYAEI
jgi:hypothetical protein